MAQAPTTISHSRPVEHAHPGPKEYVRIAAILAVITLGEVGLYYVKIPPSTLVVSLLTLSAIKFFLVAMWFMHLKFDSKVFRRLFLLGIVLAGLVYLVVLLSFHVFTPIVHFISRIARAAFASG